MRFYNIKGNEKYIQDPHDCVIGWITDYPEKILKYKKDDDKAKVIVFFLFQIERSNAPPSHFISTCNR